LYDLRWLVDGSRRGQGYWQRSCLTVPDHQRL
jgi:hypothetical protein